MIVLRLLESVLCRDCGRWHVLDDCWAGTDGDFDFEPVTLFREDCLYFGSCGMGPVEDQRRQRKAVALRWSQDAFDWVRVGRV